GAAELEVDRVEGAVAGDEMAVGPAEQVCDDPIGQDRGGLPDIGLQVGIEVGELRSEPGLSGASWHGAEFTSRNDLRLPNTSWGPSPGPRRAAAYRARAAPGSTRARRSPGPPNRYRRTPAGAPPPRRAPRTPAPRLTGTRPDRRSCRGRYPC